MHSLKFVYCTVKNYFSDRQMMAKQTTMITGRQKEERFEGPMTINCDDKGGMETIEFGKYLNESICPLHPDAADIHGSRVYIVVDNGPSHCNAPMLTWLQARGFYLLAGVPNTTHLIQDADQSHAKK
mmetsp:Transcript_19090/g.20553  ORF Transcript_19090/g.20553 Transcript_19090/m.20553 type:complete len:127 (-) Transcript_19090:23-403(-)